MAWKKLRGKNKWGRVLADSLVRSGGRAAPQSVAHGVIKVRGFLLEGGWGRCLGKESGGGWVRATKAPHVQEDGEGRR